MTSAAQISVTDRAATRIRELAASEKQGILRVSVEGGGCSGFQYRFDLVGACENEDLVIDNQGALVVIDPVSVPYMAGSQIDFVDDLIGASFRVINPNATASCGCGVSFSL